MRWSPHSTDVRRRFLVIDVAASSLTLHEISKVEKNGIQHDAIAKCVQLPSFSAFGWSLVQEPVVALGLVSGNAILVNLNDDGETPQTVTTFRVKQQRKCNSVAFNALNWLAVALDKTRSDVCLNVYDGHGASTSSHEPIRRLCPAELVSSVRFFPTQPQHLLASTNRSFIRMYDLRGVRCELQEEDRGLTASQMDPIPQGATCRSPRAMSTTSQSTLWTRTILHPLDRQMTLR